MRKFLSSVFGVLIIFSCACATPLGGANQEVLSFLQLLIKEDAPTLAEYARFSGEGDPSELELVFELKKCSANGWESGSKPCIEYIRKRWNSADKEKALFLSWVRKNFSTVGQSHHIINVSSKNEGFIHNLIEVEIGKNNFVLFKNTDQNRPTGLLVGISEINGKKITKELIEKMGSEN